MAKELDQSFFKADAITLAKKLLGKRVVCNGCEGIIVETEAYKQDPASHAFKITERSKIMGDTHGYVYVYLIYGMYNCINFTTNENAVGAVLIRAIEPTHGIDTMKQRRGKGRKNPDSLKHKNLASGPGKLCSAFDITVKHNNQVIGKEIKVFDAKEIPLSQIHTTTRIGINEGKELMWRFYIKGNQHVSVKCKNESRA